MLQEDASKGSFSETPHLCCDLAVQKETKKLISHTRAWFSTEQFCGALN